MPRAIVIHLDPQEGALLCERIRREGFEAALYPGRGAAGLRTVRAAPPDIIVIDLMRMPSYGRALAALLRENKSTRAVPLVFIEGDPEKTERVREFLPDAVFTPLSKLAGALRDALRRSPAEPIVPNPSSLSLRSKLCLREDSSIALLHAPEGFKARLAPLPPGAHFVADAGRAAVVLAFVKSTAAAGLELPKLAKLIRKGLSVWLFWPKRSAKTASDLSLPRLQELCAQLGLVGYKTCSADETWSAMAVAVRR